MRSRVVLPVQNSFLHDNGVSMYYFIEEKKLEAERTRKEEGRKESGGEEARSIPK